MSFFSKQAFAEDEDDSDIECELENTKVSDHEDDYNWDLQIYNNNDDTHNVAEEPASFAQNVNTNTNTNSHIIHNNKPNIQNINNSIVNSNTASINPLLHLNDDDDDIIFDSDSDDIPIMVTPSNTSNHIQQPAIINPTSNNNVSVSLSNNILAPIKNDASHKTQIKTIKKLKRPTVRNRGKPQQQQQQHKQQKQQKPLEFVLPSNQHLKPKKKQKQKRKKKKQKMNYNHPRKPFNYHNIKNDWKHKAGIVSTKVNNKQCPISHPKSELNIQERNKYVILRKKKIIQQLTLTDDEIEEYQELQQKVKSEQKTYQSWLENFYKCRDGKHNDYKELSHFAHKENKKHLIELVKTGRFNCLSYYYIHPDTLKQVGDIISIKKHDIKQHYPSKYSIDIAGYDMNEIRGEHDEREECTFEFLANLKESESKIPQWRISEKYFDRKYNDDICLLDILPSGLNIYRKDTDTEDVKDKRVNVTPHIVYGTRVNVSRDDVIDSTLKNNPNWSDINVVIDARVMSLLIDISANNKWKQSFMIPFCVKNNKLFIDKQCLNHEWKPRYCNDSYFKRVFRSYLAQNMMKDNMNKYEAYMNINEILSKQKEYNECMSSHSDAPHFVYSMWRLNTLHCLIRTEIYGQITYNNGNNTNTQITSNCYAALKLDYLNPHKQAFISHHKMKNEMEKDDDRNTLRNAESALYGVERLTETERLQLCIQSEIRPNNKLIIGRMQIPSRKLISCSVVDHNTLLTDHLEDIYLKQRYNNALYIMHSLFQYLLKHCKQASAQNKQYLLAYNAESDTINIFADSGESAESDTTDDNQQLFDLHGYIDTMCGRLNDEEIDYIAPYPIVYRGVMTQCHIPDLSPPTNSELPKPCQMFLFHGFCPTFHDENNNMNDVNDECDAVKCELPHYRTHILSHCWEYALYGGHCERGTNCEWPHLRQQELINKGYEMFHVRQLINYCQDYYKNGRCKNSQSGGICNAVHLNEKQLMHQFHTKYKKKQMRKTQLVGRGRILEKNLQLAQHQKLPGQRKKRRRIKRNRRQNNVNDHKVTG